MSLKLYLHPLASFCQKVLIALYEIGRLRRGSGLVLRQQGGLIFDQTHPRVGAYFDRLMERPSFARTVQETEPYLKQFPQ